jgi:hypothetical protein
MSISVLGPASDEQLLIADDWWLVLDSLCGFFP